MFTRPLQGAARTCELAGFGVATITDPDLVDWDYGRYEGLRSAENLADRPGWQLFRAGCPGGESPEEVGARADRVVERTRAAAGDVLLFFQWALHSRSDRPMAGAHSEVGGEIFPLEHRESQRFRLCTRSIPAGDSALERRSPCGRITDF